MTITVHSTPSCVQCKATDRHTNSKGIPTEHVDLSENLDLLAAFKERGYSQAPVVTVTDDDGVEIDIWTGFRPDKLDEHADSVRELASV